jgi:CheY-like chemotaxis protein
MTPIRLLLVDDEQGFVEALTRRLVKRDYQAAYVLSGEEALRFLDEDRSTDVVLLDVKMPGLDGLETLRRIKAMDPLVETICSPPTPPLPRPWKPWAWARGTI